MIDYNYYLSLTSQYRSGAGLSMGKGKDADHALHLRLFAEESNEFLEALAKPHLEEVAKELSDMVVIACGYYLDAGEHAMLSYLSVIDNAHSFAAKNGIDLVGAFALVQKSNLSKLCTPEQIEPTREKYREMGVAVEFRESTPGKWACYCLSHDPLPGQDQIPAGKQLKGAGFFKPDFEAYPYLWRSDADQPA